MKVAHSIAPLGSTGRRSFVHGVVSLVAARTLLVPSFGRAASRDVHVIVENDYERRAIASARAWKARDGQTVDQIFEFTRHTTRGFYPRTWMCDQLDDGRRFASLTWTAGPDDDPERLGYDLRFAVGADGIAHPEPTGAGVVVLGAKAFALNITRNQKDNEQPFNKDFYYEPLNLNFVNLPQGQLGEIATSAGLKLKDASIEWWPTGGGNMKAPSFSMWSIWDWPNAPSFVSRSLASDLDGIYHQWNGEGEWEPWTGISRMIATRPPSRWFRFDPPDAIEGKVAR